ncbi:MAG: type I-E CRISPR-associated protein Cse1/CasA, partial [Proteobacteria bacterium]|nr:type I-E CRISPR-associated protein Cse1/CasA [Pseudomonadota bacterium]
MNVAFDRWIPVVTLTGESKLASLKEVFTEGDKLADLAVRPHERVALMRLFMCVAHATLNGPKDYDEWCRVPGRLPNETEEYLMNQKNSFELFDKKKPWLQLSELTDDKKGLNTSEDSVLNWSKVSKMDFAFATGANSTLFDHQGLLDERDYPLHQVIVSMLTFQCFSVGGLMGQIFWNGLLCGELANHRKEKGPIKSSDGPCVPSSMIHAFLRGHNLASTIQLNIPTYEDVRFCYNNQEIGKPVWELMPSSLSDSEAIVNATSTYVGRLVPLTRFIRLNSSGSKMLLGNGLTYPFFSNGFPPEPSATVTIKSDKRVLLAYRPSKAIWRELSAILVKRKSDNTGGPLTLQAMQDSNGCDLIIAALARDKATIVDTIESIYHIPKKLITTEGNIAYESEVKKADFFANRLAWAVETYRKEIDGGWEGRLKSAGPKSGKLKAMLHSSATNYYWTTVEKNLSYLFNHIESIGTEEALPTRKIWRNILFSATCEAYRIACGQET